MKKILVLMYLLSCIYGQSPEDVGLSSARLQRLDKTLGEYTKQHHMSGMSVMIARHGKIVHFTQQGVAEIDGKAIAPDTIFRIYSMTKLVTSVAVMMLHEESKLQMYDPISKYIPQFKNLKVFVAKKGDEIQVEDMKREPTVRDFLTHTSGFTYGYFAVSPVDAMCVEAKILDRNQSSKELIEKLAKIPLKHQPGSKWEYSISTDILGYLVEVVSGQTLDEFFQERIFAPLEMKDTGFFVPKDKLERFTALYTMSNGKLSTFDPRVGYFSSKPKFLSGGGGLVSTANDYMNFCMMLLNNGTFRGKSVLSKKTVEFMMLNHLSPAQMPYGTREKKWGYGFGLGGAIMQNPAQAQVVVSKGTFQWAGAANTFFTIDPQEKMVALLFTQFWPFSDELGEVFRTLVYQTIVE